ncbi:MAG: sensor histidine kinase [Thermoanaerobaculia bacterium]
MGRVSGGAVTATAPHLESFPEAAVLPFPVESASPAITSIANLMVAGAVPAMVVGPDRLLKFMTEEARLLLDITGTDPLAIRDVETRTGLRIGELSVPATAALRLHDRNLMFTLVPLSGGASGAVLVFREAERLNDSQVSFVSFLKETIFSPLKSMREAMLAASSSRDRNPLWIDSAATIEQILCSLEMAPQVKEPAPAAAIPPVVDVLRSVSARFRSLADLKTIGLQVDAPKLEETFLQHVALEDALSILVDNAIHYVPEGGQVVIGVRLMEHKGLPLLLFFVMDNGPMVPEEMRARIFDPSFTWDPSAMERGGRALFRVRDFAIANGGSVWVESKSGKACTFFLRIRPAALPPRPS